MRLSLVADYTNVKTVLGEHSRTKSIVKTIKF